LSTTDEPEKLLVASNAAKSKAKPFGRFDEGGEYDAEKKPAVDPFLEEIAPSLLTADDIKKYVMATGLIAPFYEGGGGKSRMKDASYEGRIGEKAYEFKPEETEATQIFHPGDRVLTVPANSIIFVECDLYFRIPDFIALRFNLQIKHVHRGLLLGTGPLIDPGYWGRLCIPLHNLTDEDYDIPADEGLIWIEFTKTTKISERIGRPPLRKEYPDILKFLEKASRRFDKPSQKVGIRSSIPKVNREAAEHAAKASEKAEIAEITAEKAKKAISTIGIGAGVAAAVGLLGLLFSVISIGNAYRTDMHAQINEVKPSIKALEDNFEQHIDRLNLANQSENEAKIYISNLSEMVAALTQSVADLKRTLEAESSDRQKSEARAAREKEESDHRISELTRRISALCSAQAEGEHLDLCSNILVEPVD